MINSATQQLNFDYLTNVYINRTLAGEAAKILDLAQNGKSPVSLTVLLRDHKERSVEGADEMRLRKAFDLLLAFYSILEIASLIGYVPEPLPQEFITSTTWRLSEPSLKKYYEHYYPCLLPQLFRSRLTDVLRLKEHVAGHDDEVWGMFSEFCSLVNWNLNDEGIQTFQWFLDEGTIEGIGIQHTIEALKEPQSYLARRMKPTSDHDPLDRSLEGLQSFVTFCLKFDDLLKRADQYPLFQSAQWHYFAYWFRRIGEQGEIQLTRALQQFVSWTNRSSDISMEQDSQDINHYVGTVRSVMSRLVSGAYGRVLQREKDHR
jgi:hypothetical protein